MPGLGADGLRATHRATRVAAFACGLLMALVLAGGSASAGELTARDIVSALFKAAPGATPDLSGKDLKRLDLAGIDFKGAKLTKANLFGADLASANLAKADLAGAILDRATITKTNFEGADLTGASILRASVFSTLEASRSEVPNFTRARLAGAQLSGHFDLTSFHAADLKGTRFGPKDSRSEELITGRVGLKNCDFIDADLRGANLQGTGAQYAKFMRADLRDANLAQSNLKGADFSGADVTGADFTGAVLDGAEFTGAKGLDRARGLQEGLRHGGSAAPVQ
jgi:uncharacterized protein YjbI with pentapeptide repeats